MEASGVLVLVVADDDRIVLGDEAAEPDEAVGLAVGAGDGRRRARSSRRRGRAGPAPPR